MLSPTQIVTRATKAWTSRCGGCWSRITVSVPPLGPAWAGAAGFVSAAGFSAGLTASTGLVAAGWAAGAAGLLSAGFDSAGLLVAAGAVWAGPDGGGDEQALSSRTSAP